MPDVNKTPTKHSDQADDVDEEQHDREPEQLPPVSTCDLGRTPQRLDDPDVVAAFRDHEAEEAVDHTEDESWHDEQDEADCGPDVEEDPGRDERSVALGLEEITHFGLDPASDLHRDSPPSEGDQQAHQEPDDLDDGLGAARCRRNR